MADLIDARAGIEDRRRPGEDAGATVCIGHARPYVNVSTEALTAGIVTVWGPVTVPKGIKDSGCSVAQGRFLGCGEGMEGANRGMGGTGGGMTRKVADI